MIRKVTPKVRVLASTVNNQTTEDHDEFHWVTADKMTPQVETSEGGNVIVYAGRKCYKSTGRPNPATADDADYIKATLFDKGHWSIAEHVHITLEIDGFSRAVTHELVRHRHFNYSQESQRFVNLQDLRYVVHPTLEALGLEDELADIMQSLVAPYMRLVKQAEESGLSRKQAREAGRAVIPNAAEAPIIVTGNLRSWCEMIERRIQLDADLEIQRLARLALFALAPVVPEVFNPFIEKLQEQGINV